MNIIHVIPRTEKLLAGDHLGAHRYSTFQSVLSAESNFSFVAYDNFKKALQGSENLNHLIFENGSFRKLKSGFVEEGLVLLEYYDAPTVAEKKTDMQQTIPELLSNHGLVPINNTSSLASQDKKFLYDNQSKFSIKPPRTYHVSQLKDLETLAQTENKIIKPRFGSEGRGVEKLTLNNYSSFSDPSLYLVQDEQSGIVGEMRLIFGGDSFYGSRIVLDRSKPWESASEGRLDERIPYLASDELIAEAYRVHKLSRCEFSSVDFYLISEDSVVNKDQLRSVANDMSNYRLVEVNGFGTGFGNPDKNSYLALPDGQLGDANSFVASRILQYGKDLL